MVEEFKHTVCVTVLLLPLPLTNTTTSPDCFTFCTVAPPVTFEKAGFVNNVGRKTGVPGTNSADVFDPVRM